MSLKEKQGLSVQDMVVVGFALFSMFFGAGNTVFPPYIGMESGVLPHRRAAAEKED